jgi:TatD DNase family protein
MQLTDTHCHLYFSDYAEDQDSVLKRAWEAGLARVLIPGIDLLTSQAAIDLTESDPRLFATVGIHPNSSSTWDVETLGALERMTAHPKVVAIGEIGLDYYRDRAPRDHQKRVFREQLNLAERLELPVVVHTRNASPADRSCVTDTLQILAEFNLRGVLHSFSGNLAEADRTLELGFLIGITGPVTFKKAEELREVVAAVPLDRLLTETDGPFLTPHPYRGKRNEPAYVRFVTEKISEIKNQPLHVVAEAMMANAGRLFNW